MRSNADQVIEIVSRAPVALLALARGFEQIDIPLNEEAGVLAKVQVAAPDEVLALAALFKRAGKDEDFTQVLPVRSYDKYAFGEIEMFTEPEVVALQAALNATRDEVLMLPLQRRSWGRYRTIPILARDWEVLRRAPLELALLAYILTKQDLPVTSEAAVLAQMQAWVPEQVLAMAKLLRGVRLADFVKVSPDTASTTAPIELSDKERSILLRMLHVSNEELDAQIANLDEHAVSSADWRNHESERGQRHIDLIRRSDLGVRRLAWAFFEVDVPAGEEAAMLKRIQAASLEQVLALAAFLELVPKEFIGDAVPLRHYRTSTKVERFTEQELNALQWVLKASREAVQSLPLRKKPLVSVGRAKQLVSEHQTFQIFGRAPLELLMLAYVLVDQAGATPSEMLTQVQVAAASVDEVLVMVKLLRMLPGEVLDSVTMRSGNMLPVLAKALMGSPDDDSLAHEHKSTLENLLGVTTRELDMAVESFDALESDPLIRMRRDLPDQEQRAAGFFGLVEKVRDNPIVLVRHDSKTGPRARVSTGGRKKRIKKSS